MGYLLPAMTQQKLDTQRDVVQNERRWSMDNQPYGSWWERLPALCFPPSHPFHHSLIGSMSDLDAASLEDIEQFFTTYYTPDNAVLSIAGDFDRDEARRLVERHFGPIPRGAGKPPLPDMSLPPTFGGPLREVVPDDVVLLASVPRLSIAGVRQRRVLRGERVRRDPRPQEGKPAAPPTGARAADRGRGAVIHVRPDEGERSAGARRDGASGDDAGAARARGQRRSRSHARRRRHGGGSGARRHAHRDGAHRRRCSRPAIARTSSRSSRRTSATRRS